jgi:hypothetical protein
MGWHEMGKKGGAGGMEVTRSNPELRALVVEASQALARLDAARLEELALSCKALSRDLKRVHADAATRKEWMRQANDAADDMAVFARVLEATRANLNVMRRLREMRLGQLEYKVRSSAEGWTGLRAEDGNGNH